jgi:hypothetical protein
VRENNMPSDIGDRLEKAIREEDEKTLNRIRKSRESARDAEREFGPVRQAVEQIRDELQSMPSIEFTINPDNAWITLADREVWLGYDIDSRKFIGEECSHSWYDGEPYADHYKWDTVDECTDALIRFCARYVRMARTINTFASET